MKLANIIYGGDLVNHIKLDYINYYDYCVSYDVIDKSLPTLFVGWQFMKECNLNNEIILNADILKNKIISNELYWGYGFNENKGLHIRGVENFVKLIPEYYFLPKYNYINLDPVFFQLKDSQDLIFVIPKKIDKLYNLKNEMIYFKSDNKITGINLNIYKFFRFNIDQITNMLYARSSSIIIDENGEKFQTQYKIFPNFKYLKRYLVIILSE